MRRIAYNSDGFSCDKAGDHKSHRRFPISPVNLTSSLVLSFSPFSFSEDLPVPLRSVQTTLLEFRESPEVFPKTGNELDSL